MFAKLHRVIFPFIFFIISSVFSTYSFANKCDENITEKLSNLNITFDDCYITKGNNIDYHFNGDKFTSSGLKKINLLTIAIPTIDGNRFASPTALSFDRDLRKAQAQGLHSICYQLGGKFANIIIGNHAYNSLVYNLKSESFEKVHFSSRPISVLDCYVDLAEKPKPEYFFEDEISREYDRLIRSYRRQRE